MRKGPVAIIFGTKAELIKLSPVIHELAREGIPHNLLFTGQHNIDAELRENGIPSPKLVFDSSAKGRGRFSSKASALLWICKAFFWIRRTLANLKPSIVLVHGDTMTTAAGALGAKSLGLPLAHIEAGLRSGSLREPFPEELSRRIADKLSDYFFCPTWHSAQNLLAEGRPRGKVFVTGNTNIDVVKRKMRSVRVSKKREKFLLAKLHRHENITSKRRLAAFVTVLEKSPLPVVLILPENLKRQLARFELTLPRKVKTIDFLPQKDFLPLLAASAAILTDAGGETEEACYLGVPCVQFRERSERQEAETIGASIRTTNPKKILDRLALARGGKWKIPHEARLVFGVGGAAEEIARELSRLRSAKNA